MARMRVEEILGRTLADCDPMEVILPAPVPIPIVRITSFPKGFCWVSFDAWDPPFSECEVCDLCVKKNMLCLKEAKTG